MTLWLVRHAQPLIDSGICYGALDVPADPHATQVAALELAQVLPKDVQITTSTLQRCELLAHVLCGLRPDLTYRKDARLVEMNFGTWEGQRWDNIARCELDAWTPNFASYRCGGAESVQMVMTRVAAAWDAEQSNPADSVWIAHAGVIRAASLLAKGQRSISDASAWPAVPLVYGGVVRVVKR